MVWTRNWSSLLKIIDDPQDAFWLAQVHFSTGNYTRAQSFLKRHNLIEQSAPCKYLAAHSCIKQYKFEEALAILGDKDPVHLISIPKQARRKLHHDGSKDGGSSKLSKKPMRVESNEERNREDVADIKFEAAMCYLRGLCFAKQNAFDKAKEAYKVAVRIDVQCFEAFDQLMKNALMSPKEEWEFLETLDFDSIVSGDTSTSQEAGQFVKMLYTTRLSKYKNSEEFMNATETLSTHYKLSDNHDLLLARADLFFTQCRFKDALEITTSILTSDEYNFKAYPVHLACLHEIGQINALFLLSHRLADQHPEEPVTWLAVGTYYLSIGKVAEARRFFSKASVMDSHFGPAWIGFAHTFAAEGEHDQAIAAYSTAVRLFQGTHLPHLFLGMQNLQLNNLQLAQEFLSRAHELCDTDPLVLNELAVVFYHVNDLETAINLFSKALQLAELVGAEPKAWISTRANLGHAYRRTGKFNAALDEFNEVLRQGGKDCNMFCAKGLVLLELGQPWEAICAFHEALGVQPQDPIATDLFGRALEELSKLNGVDGSNPGHEADENDASIEEQFDNFIRPKKIGAKDAISRVAQKRREKLEPGANNTSKPRNKPRVSTRSGITDLGEESMMVTDHEDDG